MIFLYQFFLQILWLLKPLLKFFPHRKIRYYFQHQGKMKGEKLSHRPIWIHASSGEIEYARPLVRELQKQFPHIPILMTHTSLSSAKGIAQLGCQVYGISPLDTPQDIRKFLNAWNPRACLIARTDLWPQTLIELSKKKIPAYLFSATFAKGSKKVSFLSQQLLKTTLPLLKKIFFVSDADQRLCQVFYPTSQGLVLGDTRYDQVLYRLKNSPNLKIPSYAKLLIAGSTWPQDEKILIPALLGKRSSGWKMILVPHEVDKSHIHKMTHALSVQKARFVLYSEVQNKFSWDETDVLIVDKVGLLASFYPDATVAFVGGSFKKQVHSVMEALAAEKPVIVGPYFENNREAIEFEEKGFVREVTNSEEMAQSFDYFFDRSSEIQKSLNAEINRRTGATQKLLDQLKSEGLLSENVKT